MQTMTGLDRLLSEKPTWITHGRIGLLAHPASIDRSGVHAAERMAADPDIDLVKLFGPEHGFFGWGAAGEKIPGSKHPLLGLPVYSLYGEHRRPPGEWLCDLDVLVVDLQDLGVRCYTYLSSLFLVMLAAAEAGIAVAVLERPITAPGIEDGPLPEEDMKSFVAQVDLPLVHGKTMCMAAQWMQQRYGINLPALHLVEMSEDLKGPGCEGLLPWVSPSPAIRNWTTARVYPATVFCEAFPSVEVERSGLRPFQVWGMQDLRASDVCALMRAQGLAGVSFGTTVVRRDDAQWPAISLACTDLSSFLPVTTGIALLQAIGEVHGQSWLWDREDNRPAFFDQLMGCRMADQLRGRL